MNRNAVQAIVRKDLKVAFQNKGVSVPLIVAPLFILVVLLPATVTLALKLDYLDNPDIIWLNQVIDFLPTELRPGLAGDSFSQEFVEIVLVYGAAAIFPLLPLMVVTAIAADSFAGEKERKTLEALLYTPTTDWELLLGKLLSAWLPALAITWLCFLLYIVTANLAAWPVMGRLFFPSTIWLILAIWIAPAVAALGLGAMVLVSSRARTFQEANQLSAVVILPCFVLCGALLVLVMSLEAWLAVLLGLLIWAVDVALLQVGRRTFQRTRLALEI